MKMEMKCCLIAFEMGFYVTTVIEYVEENKFRLK